MRLLDMKRLNAKLTTVRIFLLENIEEFYHFRKQGLMSRIYVSLFLIMKVQQIRWKRYENVIFTDNRLGNKIIVLHAMNSYDEYVGGSLIR